MEVMPTLVTHGKMFDLERGRLLTSQGHLDVQLLPRDSPVRQCGLSESAMKKMAGNMMNLISIGPLLAYVMCHIHIKDTVGSAVPAAVDDATRNFRERHHQRARQSLQSDFATEHYQREKQQVLAGLAAASESESQALEAIETGSTSTAVEDDGDQDDEAEDIDWASTAAAGFSAEAAVQEPRGRDHILIHDSQSQLEASQIEE